VREDSESEVEDDALLSDGKIDEAHETSVVHEVETHKSELLRNKRHQDAQTPVFFITKAFSEQVERSTWTRKGRDQSQVQVLEAEFKKNPNWNFQDKIRIG